MSSSRSKRRMSRGRYVKTLDLAEMTKGLLNDPSYRVVTSQALAGKLLVWGEVIVAGELRALRSKRIGPNESEVWTESLVAWRSIVEA
jgi:hypothetical protein